MVVLTGATGFVGKAVLESLVSEGVQVSVAGRTEVAGVPFVYADFSALGDIRSDLTQVRTIIHCAGRVHIMNETADDPLQAFRSVNTIGTLALAQQAAEAGVKHFIFLSTIKVNGEATQLGKPFTADDQPNPQDPYGQSKLEAEQGLFKLSQETGMQVTVIRPPLVYGPGVGANFAKLFASVQKGTPLPLGAVHNKRSMVAIDNLVSLILTCMRNPASYGKVFLVSDGTDASTRELVIEIQRVLQIKSNLIPLPPIFLKIVGLLTGKSSQIKRLCGSLQVSIESTCETLGWEPPITMHEQLLKMLDETNRGFTKC